MTKPLVYELLTDEHGSQGKNIPVKSVLFGRIFLTSSRACKAALKNRDFKCPAYKRALRDKTMNINIRSFEQEVAEYEHNIKLQYAHRRHSKMGCTGSVWS